MIERLNTSGLLTVIINDVYCMNISFVHYIYRKYISFMIHHLATKKKAVISSGSATIVKSKGKSKPNVPSERQISDEEAMEVIEQIVNPQMLTSLDDTNWKNR